MRVLSLITLLTITFLSAFPKDECPCTNNLSIHCDTINFKSNSKLFWNSNCDSTWLTFISTNGNSKILTSLEPDLSNYATRLGSSLVKEINGSIWFKHRWISGCCMPPDIFFINPNNGKENLRIQSQQLINVDYDNNKILYFEDTTYTNIIYLNLDTNTERKMDFSKENFKSQFQMGYTLYPMDIFNNVIYSESMVRFYYNNGTLKKELIIK